MKCPLLQSVAKVTIINFSQTCGWVMHTQKQIINVMLAVNTYQNTCKFIHARSHFGQIQHNLAFESFYTVSQPKVHSAIHLQAKLAYKLGNTPKSAWLKVKLSVFSIQLSTGTSKSNCIFILQCFC